MKIKPVDITPEALAEIKKIITKKDIPDGYGLRISVADKGISCGATNYALGFDKKTSNDVNYSETDLVIIINRMEVVHLAGLKLDFITEDNIKGFSFSREGQ